MVVIRLSRGGAKKAPYYNVVSLFGFVLLWIAVILTLWSMCIYLKAAWTPLSKHQSTQ